MNHTYAVIMAGGVGSRFWPSSRAATPKQLLDLTDAGMSMIAATVDRLQPDIPPARVIVVTGKITVDAVAKALPMIPKENILAEPVGRNTAPCIGWAAIHVMQRDPDGVLAVMPSDHLVAQKDVFLSSVKTAVKAAQGGAMVTFGIKPDRPETGFGYIELGDDNEQIKTVSRFVEKPDVATAKSYLAAGNFVWNSGIFFFKASTVLNEIERQMPTLMSGLNSIGKALAAGNEQDILNKVFPTLPAESIDYGVMEGAENISCLPVDFGWSDLGSWSAAYDMWGKDKDQNAVDGSTVIVESKGCLVRAPKDKLIALVNVEDLVIVDTGDALLICNRHQTQNVKKVVEQLKKESRKTLL